MSPRINSFKTHLIDKQVEQACREMGLDFETVFLKSAQAEKATAYDAFEWIVMPHAAVSVGRVIHAIPPADRWNDLAWEEWFLLNAKLHHNVLYTSQQPQCTAQFVGELDDPDHPTIVLGRTWYYYTDPDLTPLLLRS